MKARIMKRLAVRCWQSRVAHQQSGRLLWMRSARRESAPDCSHHQHPRHGSDGPCSLWPAASGLTVTRQLNHVSQQRPHAQIVFSCTVTAHSPVSGLLYSRQRISASCASTFRTSSMLLRAWILQSINSHGWSDGTHLSQPSHRSSRLLVLPQHPIAISWCQVFAIWTHTDGSDACPALCCLSVPRFLCIHICCTFWIQQGTRVSIYVDYVLQILQSNDGWINPTSEQRTSNLVRETWHLTANSQCWGHSEDVSTHPSATVWWCYQLSNLRTCRMIDRHPVPLEHLGTSEERWERRHLAGRGSGSPEPAV